MATGWSETETLIQARHGDAVDAFLAEKGMVVSEADRRRIVLAAVDATQRAHENILRKAQGDYSPDGNDDRVPPSMSSAGPVRFEPVWADYQRQSKLRPATVKRWTPVLQKFIAFVGVDDLRRITQADVIRWRDKMLSEGSDLDPITVRDVYLAAPKALLGFASDQSKIGANPAANVTVRAKSKGTVREKDFRDEEAEKILSPQNDLTSAELKAARRWVPWLCAYTGARVNEMTQLRHEDVMQIDKVWVVHITPEAGSTKTNFARAVPIHDHLMEQGFLDFALAKPKGPLFYSPKRAWGGSPGNPPHVRMGQKIGEWVRAIGVDDPNVQPNHGWRHRFKTVGRTVGMDSQKLDFIQGHAADTEGVKYGRFPPPALKPEIDKIPRYEVVPAAALDRRKKGSRAKPAAGSTAVGEGKPAG
jgi:integrase